MVPRDRIASESGIILKTEKSVLFVIPWRSHWIIGTTDAGNLDLAHPAATKADIDYILDHVNKVLAVPITHEDIEGVYAGLRPLLAGESDQSSKLSREHAVARVAPGLIIAGGKYTTYRVMGADAVDAAGEDLPGRINPSCTAEVPLVGALGYQALVNQADRLAAPTGCIRTGSGLLDRATARRSTSCWPRPTVPTATAPCSSRFPGPRTTCRLRPGTRSPTVALHVEDVLARRTRISIEYAHRGTESARRVAEIMAAVLGCRPRRSTTRSRPTRPGSTPSAARRPSRTTTPPTRCGCRPRRCAAGSPHRWPDPRRLSTFPVPALTR